jgi:hypothetical protein
MDLMVQCCLFMGKCSFFYSLNISFSVLINHIIIQDPVNEVYEFDLNSPDLF